MRTIFTCVYRLYRGEHNFLREVESMSVKSAVDDVIVSIEVLPWSSCDYEYNV